MKTLVAVRAIDWAFTGDEVDHRAHKFDLITAWLCGWLVDEDDTRLVISMQWFDDHVVRSTLAVPKVCILERVDKELKPADEVSVTPDASV
jgi:hypothetical protein